jgi:cysteinyl-tRNA synthetase
LQQKWVTLVTLAEVLGLEVQPESDSNDAVDGLSDGEIEVMIQQRKDARKARDFAEGDRIRNELNDRGITLIDQKDGTTTWHRTRLVRLSATIDLPPASFTINKVEIISELTDEEIEVRIQQWKDARKARDFAEGDRIRNQLKDRGITLIDRKDGTTIWHRS